MERLISGLGLFGFLALAWLLSVDRKAVDWRLVAGGVLLQLALAAAVLWTAPGLWFFDRLGDAFVGLLEMAEAGSGFVFSVYPREGDGEFPPPVLLLRTFAFGVLPTVVFFASLMAVLYHLRLVQPVVSAMAWAMRRTLGTSGAESLAAAANVFVGQTEAPLVVRPYIPGMTASELHALMVGGFATISGGLLAVYVGMGIDPGHLLTAAVISAPAGLVVSKVIRPETGEPQTAGGATAGHRPESANVIEAAAAGASEGMKLAINIVAMLIAFLALLALADGLVGAAGRLVGQDGWSVSRLLGYAFAPAALMMGVPWKDCLPAGELLGLKMAVNEFIAYERLGAWSAEGSPVELSERSRVILTYALSGFSNFGAIGIQLGGIGGLAPERRADLARFAMRAMLGGAIACCMTACVAGVLVA